MKKQSKYLISGTVDEKEGGVIRVFGEKKKKGMGRRRKFRSRGKLKIMF